MASNEPGRRHLLRASAAVAVAAGMSAAGAAAPAHAAGTTEHARDARGRDLPPVPGMLGDRLANEFWYRFDETTLYDRTDELTEAYIAINNHVGEFEGGVYDKWLAMVGTPGYPDNLASFMAPVRSSFQVVSQAQLDVMDACYRRGDHRRLTAAFSWFAQGVLYDPRRESRGVPVHTMNGNPPTGYHAWHGYLRVMMFLGVDRGRWSRIAPLNGFAWAVQTVARPDSRTVSPPLPRATVRGLADAWLPRSARRLDEDFQSFPYPRGTD